MTASNTEFFESLLLDAIKKIDAVSDKVDQKTDWLDEKMSANHKDLRDGLTHRIETLEDKIEEHGIKLTRHEHNFTLLGFLVTGGIATFSGFFQWINGVVGHK